MLLYVYLLFLSFTAPHPTAKFYFVWSMRPASLQWVMQQWGRTAENKGPASVTVNGGKANIDDELPVHL